MKASDLLLVADKYWDIRNTDVVTGELDKLYDYIFVLASVGLYACILDKNILPSFFTSETSDVTKIKVNAFRMAMFIETLEKNGYYLERDGKNYLVFWGGC